MARDIKRTNTQKSLSTEPVADLRIISYKIAPDVPRRQRLYCFFTEMVLRTVFNKRESARGSKGKRALMEP